MGSKEKREEARLESRHPAWCSARRARAPVRGGLEQRKTNADGQAKADKDETLASLAKAMGMLSNGLLDLVPRQSRDKRGLSECRQPRCPVGVEKNKRRQTRQAKQSESSSFDCSTCQATASCGQGPSKSSTSIAHLEEQFQNSEFRDRHRRDSRGMAPGHGTVQHSSVQ